MIQTAFDRIEEQRRDRRDTLRLEQRADGLLWAVQEGEARPVWVRRCFPWTAPGGFVSLRDTDQEEFALVERPEYLDAASRRALELALAEAGFVFEVERILAIEEEIEIRHWRVTTRQGSRTFQTRLDDWPRPVPDGGLLVRDVAGDLYRVPRLGTLDRRSRDLLWAFVD